MSVVISFARQYGHQTGNKTYALLVENLRISWDTLNSRVRLGQNEISSLTLPALAFKRYKIYRAYAVCGPGSTHILILRSESIEPVAIIFWVGCV